MGHGGTFDTAIFQASLQVSRLTLVPHPLPLLVNSWTCRTVSLKLRLFSTNYLSH